MGQQPSTRLSSWSSEDVALAVMSLGGAYAPYGDIIREKRIDGHQLIKELLPVGNISSFLEKELGIESRLHRMVLEKKLRKLRGDDDGERKRSLSPKRHPQKGMLSRDEAPLQQLPKMTPASKPKRSTSIPIGEDYELKKHHVWDQLEAAAAKEQCDHEQLLAQQSMLELEVSMLGESSRRNANDNGTGASLRRTQTAPAGEPSKRRNKVRR